MADKYPQDATTLRYLLEKAKAELAEARAAHEAQANLADSYRLKMIELQKEVERLKVERAECLKQLDEARNTVDDLWWDSWKEG